MTKLPAHNPPSKLNKTGLDVTLGALRSTWLWSSSRPARSSLLPVAAFFSRSHCQPPWPVPFDVSLSSVFPNPCSSTSSSAPAVGQRLTSPPSTCFPSRTQPLQPPSLPPRRFRRPRC